MSRRPLLGVVHPATGEISSCPQCQHREDALQGLERDLRVKNAKIKELERDIETDARKDPMWPEVECLWTWWALACNHEGCRFEAEELYLAKPHLKREGLIGCLKAVAGAAFDPYVGELKNGNADRKDDFELIFRNKAKFKSFVKRAPGEEGSQLWKMWLIQRIEGNLSDA